MHGPLSLLPLAGALLVVLLGLSAFNAFKLPAPYHGSPFGLFLFTGLTVLLFVLLLLLGILLARNILRMYGDGRSRVLGARLRSRMVLGALLLSLAPVVFMALFSFLLMNRSLDRWFSQPVSQLRDQSLEVVLEFSHYVTGNARAEAESLARTPALLAGYASGQAAPMTEVMRAHRLTLQSGFAIVYRDSQPVAGYQVPASAGSATGAPVLHTLSSLDPLLEVAGGPSGGPVGTAGGSRRERSAGPTLAPPESLAATALRGAESPDGPMLSLGNGNDYALGAAPFDEGGVVVVALPLPNGLPRSIGTIAAGAREYWATYHERRAVRGTFLLLLSLLTVLTFFASSWLALFLSKQITRPVEALADAMDAIAAGDYRQRIAFSATEELSELISSFNQMATDLEESRLIADSSTAQIAEANRRLTERQHELELILQTIPSGVVVLDGEGAVLQVNRAFLALLPPAAPEQAASLGFPGPAPHGLRLQAILPADIVEEVLRLQRRAQRMGVAGVELELPALGSPEGKRSLSVTIAVLSLPRDPRDPQGAQRRGSVLVVEDVSEVLQAQRQVAWKEVAQRVAHEIKNPLTPISLSAERILRHLDRIHTDRVGNDGTQVGQGESVAVIRRCGEVILSSVGSMRLLVDQFASLAEFPVAQPRAASLNEIAESALMLFGGRLDGIRIERAFSPSLPPVLADPEALKRALANLIDNAAEAMNASLHRVLRVETALSEQSGMAELRLSDTGPGLSPEVRERLFLPYFSTKQRGTGLGLAIAAKIVQDHHGTIRAEQRGATGACFLIELPLARVPEPAVVAAAEGVPV